MRPIWKDGKLTVEFSKPDVLKLTKARDIGSALEAMHQPGAQELIDAIDAVLFGPDTDTE